MADLNSSEEPNVLPPKRKQPSQTLDDDSTKKLRSDNEHPAAVKPINENDELEDEDYEVDSEDEHLNGVDEIDGKGKGIIMKDDKGKGKMIEESEDDDDDDSDDEGSESDGDDDLSDDPLAEVDLDNILPSRTRRRTAPPGVTISSDEVNNGKDKDA